jgi:hypothetical protein
LITASGELIVKQAFFGMRKLALTARDLFSPCSIILCIMTENFLRINGITRRDRHEMISRAKEAILRGGGFVVDFHMFSNLSICLNFEISTGKICDLFIALKSTELQLTEESHALLADYCRRAEQLSAEQRASEVAGTLEITFIHNEPDLRIAVPPVPG